MICLNVYIIKKIMESMILEKTYQDEIRKIFQCYLYGEPYEREISTDLWKLLVYHRIDIVYASVAVRIPKYIKTQLELKKEKTISLHYKYKVDLKNILLLFRQHNIQYVILKGWTNSILLYKECYERYFSDVDILINQKDIPKIEKIMQSIGYYYGKAEGNGIRIASRKQILFQK